MITEINKQLIENLDDNYLNDLIEELRESKNFNGMYQALILEANRRTQLKGRVINEKIHN